MNDVFFLAPSEVTLSQLARVVNEDTSFDASDVDDAVTILSADGRLAMSVLQMKAEELTDEERDMFRALKISSFFCLSHRTPEVATVLLPIARALLARFGGWIGADDDGFEPHLGIDELDVLLDTQP